MSTTKPLPRAISLILSAAVLWTAPGLAAHAAAATIVREIPLSLGGAASAAAPSALAPTLTGFSVAPAFAPSFAAPSLAAPAPVAAPALAVLPAASLPAAALPSAAPAAAAAAAAPALNALPAASDGPEKSAASELSGVVASAPALEPSRLSRFFDGAVSGVQRLAASVLPAAADGPEFQPPTPNGRALVSVTLVKGDANTYAAALRRLEMTYGFRADRAPTIKDGQATVTGSVSTEHVLALSRSKDLVGLEVLGAAPSPSPNGGSGLRASASRLVKAVSPAPDKEPFVAATRRVAELEALAKSDPEKALAVSIDILSNNRETRREVRFAALRVLDGRPLAQTLPFYQKFLATIADPRVQNAKAAGADPVWYIQRHILLRYARDAETLKSDAAVVASAKTAYADRNSSVRLAAGAALRAMGVDPGPENEYLTPSAGATKTDDGPFATPDATKDDGTGVVGYHDPNSGVAPGWGKRLKKAVIGLMIAASLVWGISLLSHNSSPAPAPRPAVTTTISAAPTAGAPTISALPSNSATAAAPKDGVKVAPADTAATDHQLLENIAKSEQRIAQAQEDQAAAMKAAAQKSGGSGIMGMIMSAVIFMGIFWLFGKIFKGGLGGGAQGGGMSASTEAKADVEKPVQRFTDVEGIDEALVEASEIVEFMRDPNKFKRMGAKSPKGILFEGPPGTGKTLMARALAGETNSAFFAVSGSDFVELFVGMGARRVRELITKAANHKPAIVFIDEIDAVGKARGSGSLSGSNDEREQTINALLTAMDGFDNSGGIIFVAATNRADTLDPALLRPGRFDRKIYVGKPHMGGREAIATIHAKDKRLAAELDLAYLARRTAGLAGADIQNIVNEAALQAVRRGADAIGMEDIDEAIDRGTIGAKRSLPMPDALKKRVAYHEAGHVLANLLNENPEVRQKVNKFTIVPHGSGALGFAEMGSEEGDKYLYTREELEARIDHALGGLVAEKLIFGKARTIPEEFSPNRPAKPKEVRSEWSTGPGSDLEVATNIARTMVQTLGMGEETGLAVTAPDRRDPMGRAPFGDAVAEKTWREVNAILEASYKRVTARLTRNRHVLEALTQAVLKKETLIGDEIERVVADAKPVGPEAEPNKN